MVMINMVMINMVYGIMHIGRYVVVLTVAQRFKDRGLLVPTTPHGEGEEPSSSTTQGKLKVSKL